MDATIAQGQLNDANESLDNEIPVPAKRFDRSKRFWAIIATLALAALLSSLENSVVTTALPFIVTKLDLGADYIWVTNAFFLTATAVQPLFGQLANIWGRRWVTFVIVSLFTLGSGICGGATNGAMLIAGRAVQGIGSGGMNVIVDIIVSDLVPLRERGNYIAVVLAVYSIGIALGPWVGGVIVANTSWRWVFYINLPVGGATLIMIYLFLHVKSNKEMTFYQKLRRIDYIGNVLIIGSTIAILYALTYGGNILPWTSPRVLTPLILGLFGLPLFFWYEAAPSIQDPVLPTRLFANRTSIIIFIATFLNAVILYWLLFFLPVYFQAMLGSSPARAGVQMLPAVLVSIPGAILAVILLSRFGRYKPLHIFGFAVQTLGVGLCILLDKDGTTAEWVLAQTVAALGPGFVLDTPLPGAQAQMSEADQAATTAAWSFTRSFGSIWGVAIPAAVFSNRFTALAAAEGGITDPAVLEVFDGGNGAYMHALASFINAFPEPSRREIERGGGKLRLVKEGAYNWADACLMAYPGPRIQDRPDLRAVSFTKSLASRRLCVSFHGDSQHAGRSEIGQGALNAFVFANVMVLPCHKDLREKFGPHVVVNGIVTQGGQAANIVPSFVKAEYSVRAESGAILDVVCEKIAECFISGALAAGCKARESSCQDQLCMATGCRPSHYRARKPYLDLRSNEALCTLFTDSMVELGEKVETHNPALETNLGPATDQGNVSYKCPAMQAAFSLDTDTFNHQSAFREAAGTEDAFQRALRCGNGLAVAGFRVLTDGAVADKIKQEFEEFQEFLSGNGQIDARLDGLKLDDVEF